MIETDATEVYKQFIELSSKEMKKSLRSGLRKALTAVKRQAVMNLNSVVKNTRKRNPKFNDTLQKGVRTTRIWENRDGSIVGKVLISSTRDTGSGSYRLQILEVGSYIVGERFVKKYKGKTLRKEASRGTLQGKFYFKKTMNEMDSYYQSTMNKAIGDAVNKINGRQ